MIIRLFLCIIFWSISWGLTFSIAAFLIFPKDGIDSTFLNFFVLKASIAGGVDGIFFYLTRYFNRQLQQEFLWKNFLFWVVFWDILVPIIWGLHSWLTFNRNYCKSCDWLCFCPPDHPLLAIFFFYLFLLAIMPGYYVVAPVFSVPLGWLFIKL